MNVLPEPVFIVPKLVFIVPYRDREQQRHFFLRQMTHVLEDYQPDSYKIFFIHQTYKGLFNRGGMKNAGFKAVCDIYPNDWKDMTFVFNDVDCMPYTKNFLKYDTEYGKIKHFYGFENTLGGIFSITGQSFVESGGFPMFYGYGWEDNMMQLRVLAKGFQIDRSQFYLLYSPDILSFRDGLIRTVNKTEFDSYLDQTDEGLSDIITLDYEFKDDFINIKKLDFGRIENTATSIVYDLTKGNAPFGNPFKKRAEDENNNRNNRNNRNNIGIGLFKQNVVASKFAQKGGAKMKMISS